MKRAVIDLGTNTFNILIRDTETGTTLFADKISVRLGDGGLNSNTIAKEPFTRGIEAVKQYKKKCEQWQVDEIYAFATSAVRSASNGKDFTQEVEEETGIKINVIDGDKEAELIYLGVIQALKMPEENSLIMDIGGGSTEFIIANADGVLWKKSYLLGSSRLMEKFRPSDPIKTEEIEALEDYFDIELNDLIEAVKQYPVKYLIGSSGSFDTLAAMTAHRFQNPEVLEGLTTYTFHLFEYMTISKLVLQSDFEQRLKIPGMIPMRADLIVLACVQINFLLKRLGIKSMLLSAYSLKEGVFETLKNQSHIWQKSLL